MKRQSAVAVGLLLTSFVVAAAFVPACNDAIVTGPADMTVTASTDMAKIATADMTSPDMAKMLGCAKLTQCLQNCAMNDAACPSGCIARSTPTAQGLFRDLQGCALRTCTMVPDGGTAGDGGAGNTDGGTVGDGGVGDGGAGDGGAAQPACSGPSDSSPACRSCISEQAVKPACSPQLGACLSD